MLNMKQLFFLSMVLFFFYGCENSETPVVQIEDETTVSPTHIAVFEVEGMMCQMGCGAAIRKGLYDAGGVSEVEVVFDEENPVSEIKVFFDINKTTTEKMIHVIGGLAEMRYSAKLIKVTESKIVNVEEDKEVKTMPSLNGLSSSEASTASFGFPNLTKLLNRLIR